MAHWVVGRESVVVKVGVDAVSTRGAVNASFIGTDILCGSAHGGILDGIVDKTIGRTVFAANFSFRVYQDTR